VNDAEDFAAIVTGMQRRASAAADHNGNEGSGDPIADFVHDLNNRLLAIRGHATLALIALDETHALVDEAAAELHGLVAIVDEATAASRSLRRALTTPAP